MVSSFFTSHYYSLCRAVRLQRVYDHEKTIPYLRYSSDNCVCCGRLRSQNIHYIQEDSSTIVNRLLDTISVAELFGNHYQTMAKPYMMEHGIKCGQTLLNYVKVCFMKLWAGFKRRD